MCALKAKNLPDVPWDSLRSLFAAEPTVLGVFLFGSHAEGTNRADSDIDLGVVCKDGTDPTLSLLEKLPELGIEKVDLVALNGRDAFLEFEATKRRKVLFARPGFDAENFAWRASKKWFDYQYYAERSRKSLKRRLHGQS
jgi:predicted nucleotidyltransferase